MNITLKSTKKKKLCNNDIMLSLTKSHLLLNFQIKSDISTENIHTDSRRIEYDDVFIAYHGVSSDGHLYIKKAIELGASFIILDDPKYIDKSLERVNWALVKDSRKAWSILVSDQYDNPQNSMEFIGITGTNGKTSTVWMIKEILKNSSIPYCSIGTLGVWINEDFFPTEHTTPDPDMLYKVLSHAKDVGVQVVVMEVSSHSLVQGKVFPIKFKYTGFTSFSRDHLDFHKDMNEYFEAKALLFEHNALNGSYNFINYRINPNENFLKLFHSKNLYFYGKVNSVLPDDSLENFYKLVNSKIVYQNNIVDQGQIPFTGDFNEENFLLAWCITEKIIGKGYPSNKWNMLKQVPGRLQKISFLQKHSEIFVDYAHTPDALEKVLTELKKFDKSIYTIFGCGGDRDKGKRPLMAKIAAKHSNFIVITSDNPRSEDPMKIIDDIMQGIEQCENIKIEVEREKAIHETIYLMNDNSILLIAGKGHETYQIIGNKTIHFDDFEVAQNAIERYNI